MNSLFDEEIRGHHRMRDQLLTVVSDAPISPIAARPEPNARRAARSQRWAILEGIYTHSFETFIFLDWAHRQLPPPAADSITVAGLQAWFEAQDDAMNSALSRFTQEELQVDRIDRGHRLRCLAVCPVRDLPRGGVHLLRQAQCVSEGAGTRRRRGVGDGGGVKSPANPVY